MEAYTRDIIQQAIAVHCDDIHILPAGDHYTVYLRQANQLHPVDQLAFDEGARWIRYLKYRSNMDVGERRMPQDGSLPYTDAQCRVELRLSTIANYLMQESLVIRLLYQEEQSGFTADEANREDIKIMLNFMQRKSGLMVFSGPVSSGKTTTIYWLLNKLYNQEAKQIITMEDPVEIKDPRFLQTVINEKANIRYDTLIKASLRHHPDVLLIGEIRDEETARMVMRAALTGHLVLATIHAKDARGVIGRLRELGVSNEQLIQTLLLVSSQRLVPIMPPQLGHRTVLYELLQGADLQQFILTGQVTAQFRCLNDKLKEALADGKISLAVFEQYRLEASHAIRGNQ